MTHVHCLAFQENEGLPFAPDMSLVCLFKFSIILILFSVLLLCRPKLKELSDVENYVSIYASQDDHEQ